MRPRDRERVGEENEVEQRYYWGTKPLNPTTIPTSIFPLLASHQNKVFFFFFKLLITRKHTHTLSYCRIVILGNQWLIYCAVVSDSFTDFISTIRFVICLFFLSFCWIAFGFHFHWFRIPSLDLSVYAPCGLWDPFILSFG